MTNNEQRTIEQENKRTREQENDERRITNDEHFDKSSVHRNEHFDKSSVHRKENNRTREQANTSTKAQCIAENKRSKSKKIK